MLGPTTHPGQRAWGQETFISQPKLVTGSSPKTTNILNPEEETPISLATGQLFNTLEMVTCLPGDSPVRHGSQALESLLILLGREWDCEMPVPGTKFLTSKIQVYKRESPYLASIV